MASGAIRNGDSAAFGHLAYFPDFSADRNMQLGERLAEAKAYRPTTGAEQVDR